MKASLERSLAQENWKNAAISAVSLSELYLTLGDLDEAMVMGEASVQYSERGRDVHWTIHSRVRHADAINQAGDREGSLALMTKAEAMQATAQPEFPLLYSISGFQFCDLLLTHGRPAEVRERTRQTLQWVTRARTALFDLALDHLSLGRAALALGDRDEAKTQLDDAVDGLRQAGVIEFIPRGLLARVVLFRETGDSAAARRDLDEAMRIAKRSEMRLFQCDAHLEYARFALAEAARERAREHVAAARRLVDETGYGRRRPEVEALEAEVR